MKLTTQIVLVLLIGAVTVPLAARFVPGVHPWLDRVGLLAPLQAMGVVAEDAQGGQPRQASSFQGRAEVKVVAEPVRSVAMRDVLSVIGSARGAQSVDLSFEVAGRVHALHVAPGDRVEAGRVIAELESTSAQLAVERARLVVENARRTVERLEQLSRSGTATELQRLDAELTLRTAELELKVAESALAGHRIVAPVAGFIGLIDAQLGELVSPSTVIARVEDRTTLMLDFQVPERIATLTKIGDEVTATAISMPGSTSDGRIIAVDNRVDVTSRTLRVQASIDNADDRLRPGMAFRIDLAFLGPSYPAVDPLAIQWGAEGAHIWTVRDGKAARLPVVIVQRNAGEVLVDVEIGPDDLVVTEGVHLMRPGAEVSVVAPGS